jgi:hypothetical protein
MKKIYFLIPFILMGCANAPTPAPVPTFQAQPISLKVANVEIINPYGDFQDQGANTSLEESLAREVESWARPLFMPQGTQGRFLFTVESVSFKKNDLEKASQGITGFFTKDQEEKLKASVTVRLEFRNDRGEMVRTGVINAAKQISLPEGLTLAQKDRQTQLFTQDIIKDLDQRLRLALEEDFQNVEVTELGM